MNVEIGTEAAQFPEKEYINRIFLAAKNMWSEAYTELRNPKMYQLYVLNPLLDHVSLVWYTLIYFVGGGGVLAKHLEKGCQSWF